MTAILPSSDTRRRDAAFRVGAYAVNVLLGLAHVALTSRLLGPEQVGVYAFALLFVQPIMDFFNTGLYWSALRCSLADYPALGRVMTRRALLASLVVLASAPFHAEPWVVLLLAPCIYLAAVEGYQTGHQLRELRFSFQAVRSSLILVVNIIGSYALASIGCGPSSLAGGLAISILAGVAMSRYWHKDSSGMESPLGPPPGLVTECQMVGFSRSATNLSANVPGWALGFLGSPTALGIFNRASRMSDVQLKVYVAAHGGMVAPVMAKRGGWSSAAFWRSIRHASYIAAAMVIPGCLIAPLVIPVLLGPGWGDVTRVTQVLLCGSVFANLNKITEDYLRYHGWIRFTSVFAPIFAALSFLVYACLLQLGLGLIAVASAYVCLQALSWLAKISWISLRGADVRRTMVGGFNDNLTSPWPLVIAVHLALLVYYVA